MNADIDISKVVLTTERLILRPWRKEDLDDFFEYASVDGVGQMAGWQPHKSKEESLLILGLFIQGKKTFAIEYEGKVIGSFGIEKYDEEENPELDPLKGREVGFVLSKDYWGKGFMPEACLRVMKYLFDEIGLDFIMAGYFVNNKQSKRVQEKCGFKEYKDIVFSKNGITINAKENIIYEKEFK